MEDPAVFTVRSWETPATKYPLNKVGRAKITRTRNTKGVYRMEGVKGYEYFEVEKAIPITTLRIGRETVMVDDPLHWIGMQDLAKHCKGKVITAGLGLGLIVHALAGNPAVKSITVVEREADVIELVKPLVLDAVRSQNGNSPEIEIIKGDIFENITPGYDVLILDIWWGRSNARTYFEMLEAYSAARAAYPGMKVYIWGLKDPEMNPAISKMRMPSGNTRVYWR